MQISILTARPQTWNNHYLNKASQGALICESENWPKSNKKHEPNFKRDYSSDGLMLTRIRPSFSFGEKSYSAEVPDGLKMTSAYSDRISMWDYKRSGLTVGE